jgi:hypothetical protein
MSQVRALYNDSRGTIPKQQFRVDNASERLRGPWIQRAVLVIFETFFYLGRVHMNWLIFETPKIQIQKQSTKPDKVKSKNITASDLPKRKSNTEMRSKDDIINSK